MAANRNHKAKNVYGSGHKRRSGRETPVMRGEPNCPFPHKNGYVTRADAKKAARTLKHRSNMDSTQRMDVYLCACGFFHIGRTSKHLSREDVQRRQQQRQQMIGYEAFPTPRAGMVAA